MMDLVYSAAWALFILIVETALIWKLGPNIQYAITYRLNKREKSTRDIPVNIKYFRISDDFKEEHSYEQIISTIEPVLLENDVVFSEQSGRIEIKKYVYGSSEYEGAINFSYRDFEQQIISNLSYDFEKNCNYSTFSDEIFGLVNAIKELEERVTLRLLEKTNYSDVISCKLAHLKNLTFILNKFEKETGMGYMSLPGRMRIQLSTDEIILSDEIDEKGLELLKEMVTMYY